MGSTVLGKENASYLSSLTMEVRREEEVVLVVVCGNPVVEVLVGDWQLRTMAKRSQSSSIMQGKESSSGYVMAMRKIREGEKRVEKMALTFGVNGKRKRGGRRKRGWWSTD